MSKAENYHRIFAGMLVSENKKLHNKKHVWIIGIDDEGCVVCVYTASIGLENLVDTPIVGMLNTAVICNAKNIIMGHNITDKKTLKPSKSDIRFVSKVFSTCKLVGFNFEDHIIISKPIIKRKVNKTKNYCQVFLEMLRFEKKKLHNKKHVWVMGIDSEGHVVCVYTAALGGRGMSDFQLANIFRLALRHDSVNIVMGHNQRKKEVPNPSKSELNFVNKAFGMSKYLGLNLIEYAIISKLSLESESPMYCSFLPKTNVDSVSEDTTAQIIDDIDQDDEDDVLENVRKVL